MLLTIFDFNVKHRGIMSYDLVPKRKIFKVVFVKKRSDLPNGAETNESNAYIIADEEKSLAYYFKIKSFPKTIFF